MLTFFPEARLGSGFLKRPSFSCFSFYGSLGFRGLGFRGAQRGKGRVNIGTIIGLYMEIKYGL